VVWEGERRETPPFPISEFTLFFYRQNRRFVVELDLMDTRNFESVNGPFTLSAQACLDLVQLGCGAGAYKPHPNASSATAVLFSIITHNLIA
jgi:hypothetical protein